MFRCGSRDDACLVSYMRHEDGERVMMMIMMMMMMMEILPVPVMILKIVSYNPTIAKLIIK